MLATGPAACADCVMRRGYCSRSRVFNANLLLTARPTDVMLQCPEILHIRGDFNGCARCERSLRPLRLRLNRNLLRKVVRHPDVRVDAPAGETPPHPQQMIHFNRAARWVGSTLAASVLLI